MFAAIYVPNFPLAAVVRAEPELREQAVAVVEGTPPLVSVIAINHKAAAAGVEIGMTKLQVATCAPAVELRQRSKLQETAAHAALLDYAQAFSPRVEDTAADTAVLDIAGLERLFGPPARLAHDLARRVSDVGLEANIGVASNPDAAIHAARGIPSITIIPPGKEAEHLRDLPIHVLFAPNNGGADVEAAARAVEILETLDRWGVRTFRALAALPKVALSERLGQEGLRLQTLARGQESRPLIPAEPPLHFEEAMELEHPVELLEPLAFILARLLDQLCARLAARALATNELRLTLGIDVAVSDEEVAPQRHGGTEDCRIDELTNCRIPPHQAFNSTILKLGNPSISSVSPCLRGEKSIYQRSLHLPVPMLDAKVFLKLLQLELKAHPPGAPVVKVMLVAEPARPRPSQNGLFLPASPLPERLELTLARLRGVVGEEKVGAAELLDTHRPGAFRMRRFAPAEQGLKPHSNKQPVSARLKPCPDTNRYVRQPLVALRVLRPPLLAAVEFCGGRPSRLTTRTREVCGDAIACAGPWRTSGDWWRESAPANGSDKSVWNREEWDLAISNRDGVALYRIYRDLTNGEWFVEGQYD